MRACAFDEMASTYDEAFTDTAVGRALREIVWSRFEPLFSNTRHVLELGCGTGEDAVRLAHQGIQVTATDASGEMIRVARGKAADGQCTGCIDFHCLPMEQVRSLPGRELFDGALSNFGAVNCVQDMSALVADLAGRLTAGAPLLWVVMGRYVPWEWLWYLARGDGTKAWRRLRRGGCDWRGLTIHYPTPGQVKGLLRPYFKVTRVAPLGALLPPSYAAGWLDRSPGGLRLLSRLEKWVQPLSPLALLSDHFMVEAVRTA